MCHPGFIRHWFGWGLLVFFFFAGRARKTMLHHLRIVLPGSSRLVNYSRVFRIFANFGWTLADAAVYRLQKPAFTYELEGEAYLQELASAPGVIVLTAHRGNYELGAALFAQKFDRHLRMVRAPESDALTAQHVDLSLHEASAGGVQVGYSGNRPSLALDLLNALRNGEIISIQGDRVIGDVATSSVKLFGHKAFFTDRAFRSFVRDPKANLPAVHRALGIPQVQDHRLRTNRWFARSDPRRRNGGGDAPLDAGSRRTRQNILGAMVRLYTDICGRTASTD